MYRLEVFDRDGRALCELHELSGLRWSYALNKAGTATFDIHIEHPKATAEFLAHGNTVLIRHDELEPWGGYIENPSWSSSGDVITVSCAGVMQILADRRSDVITLQQKPASEIFGALIVQANREEHTGIYVGDVTAGTTLVDFELRRDNIYDKIQELLEQSKLEWYLTYVDPFTWVASLSKRLGRDLTGSVAVQAGHDTAGLPEYAEELTGLANKIIGVGKLPEGFTVPENEDEYKYRPVFEYRDPDSIRVYKLREDVVEFDTEDASELARLTIEEVRKRAYPLTTLSFQLNKRGSLWSEFRDGDIIAVQLPRYGYTGVAVPVRVLGREIDEAAGAMTVACEIVHGKEATSLDMFRRIHYGTRARIPGTEIEYPD